MPPNAFWSKEPHPIRIYIAARRIVSVRAAGLSIQQLAGVWIRTPKELRIVERHKDAAPTGVKDDGSTGPCATANGSFVELERADLALWPLHSLPGAETGENRKSPRHIDPFS